MISLWIAETTYGLEFGSAAVAADPDTRALVEDVLKGLLATLRMAAQDRVGCRRGVIARLGAGGDDQRVRRAYEMKNRGWEVL